jgi:alpha-galactosidase
MPGHRIRKLGDLEVWTRELSGGNRAVVLLNRGATPADMQFTWADLGYPDKLPATVHDLWKNTTVTAHGSYAVPGVPSHGVAVLQIAP